MKKVMYVLIPVMIILIAIVIILPPSFGRLPGDHSLRISAYTPMERINIWRGKAASGAFAVHNDSRQFNAFDTVPDIEIPIYFFAGENDMTCCTSLQKDYYEMIEAPRKEFFLYEGCAHSPVYEDRNKTGEILERIIGASGER